ncbi:M48 family metalloprotease [Thermodesulfobacteriota bacterium]
MLSKIHVRSSSTPFLLCLIIVCLIISQASSNAFALSVEDEEKLGKEFLIKVKQYFEIIDDDFSNQFINTLGNYLSIPLETRYFPFHFYIIKDNSLNAFAAPGGRIFIFSGLIEAVDELDQLAAVICHEIGHVSARHLSKRIEQSTKINLAAMAGLIAGIFLGGKAGAALATGSLAAGMQAQLHYSREDERQADQLGYKYMRSSGFDPGALIDALVKIEKGSWFGTNKVPAYLLTHPKGPERMSNLESLLANSKGAESKPQAEQLKKLFPFFKVVIRAKSLDPDDAERLFLLDHKKDTKDVMPQFGLGLVYKEKSEFDNAISYLKKASEIAPRAIPILTNLGESYLMKGQNMKAIEVFRGALNLDSRDKATLFLLGLSYEKQEDYRQSADFFERLASLPPVKDQVYYHLGLSYGRRDILDLAHYNFAIYFKKMGEIKKARFHLKKAEELSDNNPALREKIKKELTKER